jgi:hypothetical protein
MARTPPRFVPTLTEVVHTRTPPAPQAPEADPVFLEEQLVQRVLQRVDLVLERKVREAIATVLLEHTRTLAPQLRDRLEGTLREVVTQALAQEIASQQQNPNPAAHQPPNPPRG